MKKKSMTTPPHGESEIYALQKGYLERFFFRSKIVFSAKHAANIRPGETFCICGGLLQGITEEVQM